MCEVADELQKEEVLTVEHWIELLESSSARRSHVRRLGGLGLLQKARSIPVLSFRKGAMQPGQVFIDVQATRCEHGSIAGAVCGDGSLPIVSGSHAHLRVASDNNWTT